MRKRTSAHQTERNVSFSETFAYVLNGRPQFILISSNYLELPQETLS